MLLPPGTAAQGRGGIPIPGGIGIPVDAALGNTDRGWPGKGWEWSDSVSEAFPTSIIPGFHDSDPLSPSPVGAKSWKIQPFQRFFLDYELPVSCWDFRREGLIPKKNPAENCRDWIFPLLRSLPCHSHLHGDGHRDFPSFPLLLPLH